MREVRPKGYIPPATIRASLTNGFQVFADDVVPLAVVTFLVITIGTACRSLIAFDPPLRYIGLASSVLIAGPLEFGMSFICLRAVRSGQVRFEHLIAVLNRYWQVVIATAILWMIIPGALSLLLIPGIYVFCVTRFVPFLLLEDELDGASAIIESYRLSRGHELQLFGICAVGVASTMLGAISILGLIPALVWWNLSLASLYHSVARSPEGWAIEDQESLEEPEDFDEDELA